MNQTMQNYVIMAAKSFIIAGQVLDANESIVEIQDDKGVLLTKTDAKGRYSVLMSAGWSGYIRPVNSGYSFDPEVIKYESLNQDYFKQNYRQINSGT